MIKLYEITYIDNGKTEVLTEQEAIRQFGKNEWPEYRENYLPHVVVCEL